MLLNLKALYGHKLSATDGEIGHIKDFYFEEQHWGVRYLVAETGSWLTGRQVLISPHAFNYYDRENKQLHVKLSRLQILQSPSIEARLPVMREHEEAYFTYHGWPQYWTGDLLWSATGFPQPPVPAGESPLEQPKDQDKDFQLRSTKALKGYDIQATDGHIGSVISFMVDDKTWTIGALVVQTGHWYWGKEIQLPISSLRRIFHEEALVFVNLSKAEIQDLAERELAQLDI